MSTLTAQQVYDVLPSNGDPLTLDVIAGLFTAYPPAQVKILLHRLHLEGRAGVQYGQGWHREFKS